MSCNKEKKLKILLSMTTYNLSSVHQCVQIVNTWVKSCSMLCYNLWWVYLEFFAYFYIRVWRTLLSIQKVRLRQIWSIFCQTNTPVLLSFFPCWAIIITPDIIWPCRCYYMNSTSWSYFNDTEIVESKSTIWWERTPLLNSL